ncbi:MAG: hypothetical protein IH847_09435 [Acidobacteria bacterium]|nr:hypothetical protein [Acidobacteriota bacterium]
MAGTYELTVEIVGQVLALGTVVVCLLSRCFRRYVFLNLYLLMCTGFSIGNYYVRSLYGYTSEQYYYFYFMGDAVMMFVAYLVIGSFFDHLFRHSVFCSYIRPALVFLFLLVVGISGLFIFRGVEHFYSGFVIELEQNMYFVGVVLVFLLWTSMSYLGAQNRRFVLLVAGMGILFAAHAANYAIRFLFPSLSALTLVVPPLAYNFMVGLWLYTFLWVPEEEVAVQPARQVFQRLAPVGAHSLKK